MPPLKPRKPRPVSLMKKAMLKISRDFLGGKGRAMPKRTSRGPRLGPIIAKAPIETAIGTAWSASPKTPKPKARKSRGRGKK